MIFELDVEGKTEARKIFELDVGKEGDKEWKTIFLTRFTKSI